MHGAAMTIPQTRAGPPLIRPLGDGALIVQFGTTLSEAANRAAIACARSLESDPPRGATEITQNLVSVLVRYDSAAIGFEALAGEVRLALGAPDGDLEPAAEHHIRVWFGGAGGPDLEEVAEKLGMTAHAFIEEHGAKPLRVLATGFAPGFVYCGFHPDTLELPRRREVRRSVPAGTVLFAARQTAIAATAVPTGWHVIGRTGFRNFQPLADPPTSLRAGDIVRFEVAT